MKTKAFLYIFAIVTLLACQNNKTSINNKDISLSVVQEKQKKDTINYENIVVEKEKLSEIEKVTLNVELLEIVKQDNKYKYSCANPANYEYVLLTKDSLSITEIEPLTFPIKIEYVSDNEILVIKEIYVPKKFRVSIVDKRNGITSWKSINQDGSISEEPFSFYAIPVENLDKARLEIQTCD